MNADTTKEREHGHAILIIDDDSNNLAIVSALLEEYSYTIYVAEDGESGIGRALLTRPDLILLDVLMPGIDGFETCRRLKGMEETRDIPVIFMTALAETEQKVKGFAAGAVDYVTKPLQRDEVLARVGVHLHLRHLAMQLQEANQSLERRVRERTETLARTNEQLQQEIAERRLAEEALSEKQGQLEALNLSLEQRVSEEVDKNRQKDRILFHNARMVAMGELLSNIGHQWRQPLNSIGLLLQGCLLESASGKLDKASLEECVKRCMELLGYLSNTISVFQRFYMPEGEPAEFDPCEMMENALSLVRASYEESGIAVTMTNNGSARMTGFGIAFSQAVLSILNNAKDVLVERGRTLPTIEITCNYRDGSNQISIRDNAGGIDDAILDRIFDPYFTTKFPSQGVGLGLYMAKMIIEKTMGGKLSVQNVPGGAQFLIELPV